MGRNNQSDPKAKREAKSNGNVNHADEGSKNNSRTTKKQSASRHKPGSDK